MSESTPPNAAAEPSDDEPFYRQPWARFAIGFSVIVMLSEVLYQGVILESDLFQSFVRGLAEASAAILTPFYEKVSVLSARVATNKFVVTVDKGCDGLQVCTLLTSAILAVPSTWKQKWVGIIVGNLWLQTWNVIRIASLVVVGGIDRDWFHPTHVYIWPTLLIALCLATWVAWARWTMPDDTEPDRAEPAAAT